MDKNRIIIYLILTAALMLSLNCYIASSPMYIKKTAKVDKNFVELNRSVEKARGHSSRVLVIGNSYVENSFNPENESDKISMFRVSGMPMVDMLGVIEHLPEETTFDTILVGLGYNYATPVGGISKIYDTHFTGNPLHKAWGSVPLVRGRSIASTVLKEDVKCLALTFTIRCNESKELEAELDEGAIEKFYNPDEHQREMQKSIQSRYKEYVPFTSQLDANFAKYLLRMQRACDRRNIKLYAYTAPIYSELRKKLPEDILDQFRTAAYASGVKYVDLNVVFPEWNARMFSDATHVDKILGGKITTNYLLHFAGIDFMD